MHGPSPIRLTCGCAGDRLAYRRAADDHPALSLLTNDDWGPRRRAPRLDHCEWRRCSDRRTAGGECATRSSLAWGAHVRGVHSMMAAWAVGE